MADPTTPAAFDLAFPGDIRFGSGRIAELPTVCAGLGIRRALVVTGRSPGRTAAARAALADAGVSTVVFTVSGEPSVDVVGDGVRTAREAGCDGVIGYGGGSALDTAKAVAVLVTSDADPLDHLEVVGRGLPITTPGVPCVTVPTTAGSGSEVTRNSVLSAQGVKASLRSPLLLARAAIVDPDLLAGLGAATIAASGMDALAQLIEPFLSARANPVTDALARDGLRRSARSLRAAVEGGLDGDEAAGLRTDLALASLLGGLCLANSGLGAVHGIAGFFGGRYDAPHGAVCAALLPAVVETNLRALSERAPGHPAVGRVGELAALLTGRPDAEAADAVRWLADLQAALGIPGLGAYGADVAAIPEITAGARAASSMKANPVVLTDDEIEAILRSAL